MVAAVCKGVFRGVLFKQVVSFQCMASSAKVMPAPTNKPAIVDISPVLRFHKFNNDNENAPIALLMPWATATESALDRFRTLYAERGFNVLTAYAKRSSYIWPRWAEPVAAEILEYIRTRTGESPIVVHAFSIGAFMYSMALKQVMAESRLFAEVNPRIRGQVFDSIVIGTLKEQREGTAQMMSGHWLLQNLISTAAAVYFALTPGSTVAIYERAIEAFWENPFETPIMCYYSLVDPMLKVEAMDGFIQKWEERTGKTAYHKAFPDSPHAGNLRAYPQEYKDYLYKYLDNLKLESPPTSPQKSKL